MRLAAEAGDKITREDLHHLTGSRRKAVVSNVELLQIERSVRDGGSGSPLAASDGRMPL